MDRVTNLDDPHRCKGAAPDGQCTNVAEDGSEYCRAHGGNARLANAARRGKYNLTRQRARVAELANHEEAKTLREEIAMVNQMIEEVWNRVDSDAALVNSCGQLNQLFMTLEKLIKTSEAVEKTAGMTLSKTTIIVFGQEMIGILKEELRGVPGFEERVDRITNRMLDTIEQTTNKSEDE